MKICGIISEYNPFHNGHAYHIEEAKRLSGADYMLCVMSGNFTQRGEPAVFDKWIRAEAALKSGADIVAELPVLAALQSAEGFASGGVRLLNAMGADMISFGSETEDSSLLNRAALLFADEPEEFKTLLKQYLKAGEAYPYARLKAAAGILGFTPAETQMLSNPNAILGMEYLKALKRTDSHMEPYIVRRKGSGYNEPRLAGALSSATAIRKAVLKEGFSADVLEAVPKNAQEVYRRHIKSGFEPVSIQKFGDILLYALRKGGIPMLKKLYEVSEGLEHRIQAAAESLRDIEEILSRIKTRRYTHTRLSRILMYALLGIEKGHIEAFNREEIPYARILGVRRESEPALAEISRRCRVPLITNPGKKEESALYFDTLSSDIYALSQKTAPYCQTRRDFSRKFLKV